MRALRLAGRVALLATAIAFAALIGIQFASIVARNVAMSKEVAASRAELDGLRAKKRHQLREIARLSDPRGAVPEIHDELQLVGPHEELIHVEGLPQPTPAAEDAP